MVDIDLRVIGLLKAVTFAGAVTKSGAETEDIAQWVQLVGSGSSFRHGIIINSLHHLINQTQGFTSISLIFHSFNVCFFN